MAATRSEVVLMGKYMLIAFVVFATGFVLVAALALKSIVRGEVRSGEHSALLDAR